MGEEILTLARAVSGAPQAEEGLLALLCAAAEQAWTKRLRTGLLPADCGGAFSCAAAFTAAAGLLAGRGGRECAASYTAGSVSVTQKSAGERDALAESLHQQAEWLMTPYAAETYFAFCGVRG